MTMLCRTHATGLGSVPVDQEGSDRSRGGNANWTNNRFLVVGSAHPSILGFDLLTATITNIHIQTFMYFLCILCRKAESVVVDFRRARGRARERER